MCIACVTIGEVSTPDNDRRGKKRPKIMGKIGNRTTEFLVDTGASVSVCSEKMFKTCWNSWNFNRLPLPPTLRLSGVTGHDINIIDYVEMDLEIADKKLTRPIIIVSGLDKTHCILGYDFVKEEGLIIDGAKDEIYFANKKPKNWDKAAIQTIKKQSIPPRTIEHIEVVARTGKKCIDAGEIAFCTPAPISALVFYDSLTKIREGGKMTLAVINCSNSKMTLKAEDTLGFAYKAEDYFDSVEPLTEESVESIFGEIGQEPVEPRRGKTSEISNQEREKLSKRLQILTTDENWKRKYEN